MAKVSRRRFLGATAGTVLVAGMKSTGRIFGANARIRIGVVGLHGRGRDHIQGFAGLRNAEVVALCDVDAQVLERQTSAFEQNYTYRPRVYTDMRDLYADAGVDAVSIATPNHWHALATIWACEAGKDVYVEKPLSHSIWEGRQVVEAAALYGRIIQHGAQRRSEKAWVRAMQRLHDGVIGDVYMARIPVFKKRDSIGKSEPADPPDWLDWKQWQGPARNERYRSIYVHYDWHWFWKYGNGDLGNNAVHFVDIALWALQRGVPNRFSSTGGRFGYEDIGETPNTQIATCTYDDGALLVIDVRGRATNKEQDVDVGILCYGTQGYMANTRFYTPDGVEMPDERGALEAAPVSDNHYASFIDAIYSRRESDIRGTALDGHRASAVCHCANIAYRTERNLRFDNGDERFLMDARANGHVQPRYQEGYEVPDLVGSSQTT